MSGVLVLGEVLCDLFPPKAGVSFVDVEVLVPLLGGAPANVAVQLARKGVRTALVSAVGTDPLGARLIEELRREGVDVSGVHRRAGFRTGTTLVEVDADGERRFFPLTDKRADLSLSPLDVDERVVSSFSAVHTGTVGLRATPSRRACEKLVRLARKNGALVSLDVNLRRGMYASAEEMLMRARKALAGAHVVKATRDEARLLLDANKRTGDRALAERLLAEGPSLVMLTLDADGALLATKATHVRTSAPVVDVVDATGAGDAFVGAALAALLSRGVTAGDLPGLDEDTLEIVAREGCAAGSATCTALGATTAMPRG